MDTPEESGNYCAVCGGPIFFPVCNQEIYSVDGYPICSIDCLEVYKRIKEDFLGSQTVCE